MKLRDKIIVSVIDMTIMSLGLTAIILFTSGVAISITGLTGKAIEKTAEAIKPYKGNLEPFIVYGTASTFLGLIVAGSGLIVTKGAEKYLSDLEWLICEEFNRESIENSLNDDETDKNDETFEKPEQCNGCLFYCENDYLHCAVNPKLSEGCMHFVREIK